MFSYRLLFDKMMYICFLNLQVEDAFSNLKQYLNTMDYNNEIHSKHKISYNSPRHGRILKRKSYISCVTRNVKIEKKRNDNAKKKKLNKAINAYCHSESKHNYFRM